MTITINGTTGISGVDGSAGTPAVQGSDTNTGIYFPAADTIGFAEGGAQCGEFDSSANFKFNSGYGSVATAYGCRAWVNFNGTSTVAIRASGNVSSITDNGTGDYTVNFTTEMPDTNYAVFIGKSTDGDQFMGSGTTGPAGPSAYATTSIRIYPQRNSAGTNTDTSIACVSIFR